MREGASMTKSQVVSVKDEIQKWWADNPMTYGEVHGETSFEGKELAMGSKAFFERLDREFYNRSTLLHRETFDQLFPYEEYPAGSRVLEVGCGLGTMAMNWAKRGVKVTAVDLNPVSILQTKKRFETYGLEGEIRLEDANELSFEDRTFDYAYSWGVLHHSPNLEHSVAEMMRVTRPGGGFGIMLYNRNSLLYRYTTRFIEGFLHFESEFLSPLELASRYADASREEGNPYTWPVTGRNRKPSSGPIARICAVAYWIPDRLAYSCGCGPASGCCCLDSVRRPGHGVLVGFFGSPGIEHDGRGKLFWFSGKQQHSPD
jgi:SAM-dependent methyltransferase